MSHPYRTSEPLVAEVARQDPEVLAVYVVIAVLGAVRLFVALALGETFGAEDTVALAMLVGGLIGIVRRR